MREKTWMPATSAGMTVGKRNKDKLGPHSGSGHSRGRISSSIRRNCRRKFLPGYLGEGIAMVAWRSVVRVLTIGAAVGLALGVRIVGYLAHSGAQAIPKSLEEGGADSDGNRRKNQRLGGVAGQQLSGS